MELGLRDRVALVAAASQGIGYACAEALAREGAAVAVCSSDEERIQAAAVRLRSATGAQVLGVKADLTEIEEIEALVEKVRAWKGAPEVLVTNSGGPPPLPFDEATDEDWYRTVDLLLLSAVRLIRQVLPDMVDRGWGRVVAITSVACRQPHESLLLSNSVRVGVHGLLKTLTATHAAHGVTFNAVMPGHTWTARAQQLAEARADARGVSLEEMLEEMHRRSPTLRVGRPEEIAAAVAFLASEQAAFINGVSLLADGGESRGLF